MRLIITFVTLLFACLPYADLREYHYNPPQTPLNVGLAPQAQTIILRESFIQPQAPAPRQYTAPAVAQVSPTHKAVMQNFGPKGTAYIARQLPNAVAAQGANVYLPPHNQNSNGASQAYYNQAGGNAAAVAASYHTQQQQQQQGHHQQQQQQQQQYYSPNVNPLTQQQQQARYVNLPQQPQQQYSQTYVVVQQQQQQHAGGGGAALNGAGGASYYADGNGGAGGFGAATLGPGHTLPLEYGKYVSQSEAGQLHTYKHQQQPKGDTRPFARQITTCYPNGHCESVTLGPGQPDHRHQHTVAATRAKIQPSSSSDKCKKKAETIAYEYNVGKGYGAGEGGGGGGYGYAAGGVDDTYAVALAYTADHVHPYPPAIKRPHDRRLFPYSETVMPNDPYN